MPSPSVVEGYAATDHSGSGAKSASVSLPAGATILIVSAARNDNAAGPISGVTYGGVALTQIPDSPQVYGSVGIGKCALSVWELDDLSAVSGTTLAWTQSGPTTIQATFITSPAVRTDTAGNLWSQSGGDKTVNVTPVMPVKDGVAIVACGQHDGFSNPIITPYGSQIQLSEDTIDNVQLNVSYLSGITGTQAVGGSFSGSLGSTFQPRVIAALYESGAPTVEPVAPGGRGRPGAASIITGPPMVKVFGPGGRGRPATGVRVASQGPATFLLNVPRRDRPQLVGFDGSGYVRGDGSPAQEGDVPVWHTSRPPTLEEPPTGGASDHGALTGLSDDDHPQYTTEAEAEDIADAAVATHAATPHGSTLTVEEDDGSPSVSSVDKLVFPAGTVTDLGSGDVSVRELPVGAVGAKAYHNTTQGSLAAATYNPLNMNSEDWDTDGFHEGVTNPSRMTIPAHLSGYRRYLVRGQTYVASTAATPYLRINGTTLVAGAQAASDQPMEIVAVLRLQPGDYVELCEYHASGTRTAGAATRDLATDLSIELLGSGNIAGFAKETIGRTTVGANFESSTARICYKQVTVTKPGLITSIAAHVKGNGSNVGHLAVALYADNAGVPGALLAVGPAPAYVNGQYVLDIYKSTTAAWVARPLNAWVEAGTYWLAVYVGAPGAAASMQIAYDGTGDYHLSHPGWFPDAALSAPSAASRSYSIKADIIYGGQGERGYREGTSFPVGAPAGTMFYRTDIHGGMLFRYDGTRWLSDQLFRSDVGETISYVSTDDTRMELSPVWTGGRDVYVVRAEITAFVATTNSGSHYWGLRLMGNNGSAWSEPTGTNMVSTSAHAANVWARTGADVGYVWAANQAAALTWRKNGSPGNLTAMATIYFRLIAT